jgi:hypothetical protein
MGLDVHNAGSLFQWAAATHSTEVRHHAFPGTAALGAAHIEVFHISSVPDLVEDISAGNVAYLAYFGHSWDSWLFIGQSPTTGSNLSASSIRSQPNPQSPIFLKTRFSRRLKSDFLVAGLVTGKYQ